MSQAMSTPPGSNGLQTCLEILAGHFASLGAESLELPFLFASEELLNLYGEDLRGRAFLYGDAERGDELCLRPDFTVPVAMVHRARGWDRSAFYTYSGPVFRLQPLGTDRPVEYIQAGIERFGDTNVAVTDAEVFLALRSGLSLLGIDALETTIGDLSIVLAVLDALDMPARRRDALKRHLWRPKRFQDLLNRAVQPPEVSEQRCDLFAQTAEARLRTVLNAGEEVGLRDVSDVLARLADASERAFEPNMSDEDAKLISEVLSVKGPIDSIAAVLGELTGSAGVDISGSLERFQRRLDHLIDAGCDADTLHFDAAYGRSLEYYDGFVFEMRKAGAEAHPPLAGGGRYNAMTLQLGASQAIPAVGGIVRPEAVLDCLT